jgi:hypothetical protein
MQRQAGTARTSSSGNPITASVAVPAGVGALVVLLKIDSGTNRAGGALTWGPYTLAAHPSNPQKAVTTPEVGVEMHWLLNPAPGTQTLTIPNTGALTIKYTIERAIPAGGGTCALGGTSGSNNTSTNPTPGNIAINEPQELAFAIVAGGHTTWSVTGQAGTAIANTDDGAHGGGEQYALNPAIASAFALNWNNGTSEDWGALVASFREVPANAVNNFAGVRAEGDLSCVARVRA